MSIITKRGDNGETDLMFGKRIAKTHPRVEAYGNVDELNAAIGVARCTPMSDNSKNVLGEVQELLVGLMGEMATLEEDLPRYYEKGYARITDEHVKRLEEISHQLEQECNIRFKGWAIPGKQTTIGSAQLDLARTVCRRCERHVVGLSLAGELSNYAICLFLNRMSDLLWILARFETMNQGE